MRDSGKAVLSRCAAIANEMIRDVEKRHPQAKGDTLLAILLAAGAHLDRLAELTDPGALKSELMRVSSSIAEVGALIASSQGNTEEAGKAANN